MLVVWLGRGNVDIFLSIAPLPNGLYFIEDGRLHYDTHVETNQPNKRYPKKMMKQKKNKEDPSRSNSRQIPTPHMSACTRSKATSRT
jgi:hypothetical protein